MGNPLIRHGEKTKLKRKGRREVALARLERGLGTIETAKSRLSLCQQPTLRRPPLFSLSQKLVTSLQTTMSNQGQQPYQAFGEEEEDVFGDEMNFGVQGDYEGTYNEAESGTFSSYSLAAAPALSPTFNTPYKAAHARPWA